MNAFMALPAGPIHVYCYHCGRRLEIGRRTMSTLCSGCHKTVLVEDIVVKGYKGVNSLETCGKLIVRPRGHAAAQLRIIALAGIEVEGRLQCKSALTLGCVRIGGKAEWRGDLSAGSLLVEPGAVIKEGYFKVPDNPFDFEDGDAREEREQGQG